MLLLVGLWVFGLLIGSFLTVVIERVPDRRSIVTPGSTCDSCGRDLTPLDLVPVVSWVVLRGRCRGCSAPIGIAPVLVELATATVFVLLGWQIDWRLALPGFLVLGAALVALTAIDLRLQRLPREIVYVAFGLGVPWLVADALVEGEPERVVTLVLGAVIALGVFVLIYVGARGGFGEGDVRLAPLLGAYLGWFDLWHVAVGLFLGFVFGALVGVVGMATGRAGRKTALPFGPFMALGALVGVLAGEPIVDVWLQR